MLTHVALMLYIVDMELRRAEPPDAIAVARVHVRSWQAAYRKVMPMIISINASRASSEEIRVLTAGENSDCVN